MSDYLHSVVVPMYNEELVVEVTYNRLKKVMDTIEDRYELVFVNDGSRDKTIEILSAICEKDPNVKLVDFSRNFGHQVAITAGMDFSEGDTVVVIDGDLQDPPELIPEMIKKWKEGYEVVYGKRLKRKGESFFKKFTAKVFYRLLNNLTEVDIPVDTGDFRLIDRKVCDALKQVNERNRYIRGLVSWLGFKQTSIEFNREERFAGETKYPLKKMLKFATDAIISFSFKPLRLASYAGFLLSFFSFIYLIVVLYQRFFTNRAIVGWASTMAVSLFFNGIVLLMLGIIGEYIGRIYDEAKGRPLYLVKKTINFENRDLKRR